MMSPEEFFTLQALVEEQSKMVTEQIEKSKAVYDVHMDLDQMRFILSLHPVR